MVASPCASVSASPTRPQALDEALASNVTLTPGRGPFASNTRTIGGSGSVSSAVISWPSPETMVIDGGSAAGGFGSVVPPQADSTIPNPVMNARLWRVNTTTTELSTIGAWLWRDPPCSPFPQGGPA